VDGSIAILTLTGGKEAIIDIADVPLVDKWNWRVMHKPNKGWYVARTIKREDGRQHSLALHRFLLGATDPKVFVDHINHDALDNRRLNLRKCTPSESNWNMRIPRRSTTGFKGVSRYGNQGKYRTYIAVRGVVQWYYSFDTPEAAFSYRQEVLSKLHGEFYCAG
jgi:hypothetical protein